MIMGPSECEGTGAWSTYFVSREGIAIRTTSKSVGVTLSTAMSDDEDDKKASQGKPGRKRYGRVGNILLQLKARF